MTIITPRIPHWIGPPGKKAKRKKPPEPLLLYATQLLDLALVMSLVLKDTSSPAFKAVTALLMETLDDGRSFAIVEDPVILGFIAERRQKWDDLRQDAYMRLYELK